MSTDSSLCCRWCGKCIGLVRCVALPRPGVSGRLLPERTTEQMSWRRFHFVRSSFSASRDAASQSSRQLVRNRCPPCSIIGYRAELLHGMEDFALDLHDEMVHPMVHSLLSYRLVRFDSVIARASCCRCVALLWPKRAACQGPRRAFSSLCERLKHIEESLAASNFERCRVLATATSHEADIVRLESANATLHAVRSDTPTALNP